MTVEKTGIYYCAHDVRQDIQQWLARRQGGQYA